MNPTGPTKDQDPEAPRERGRCGRPRLRVQATLGALEFSFSKVICPCPFCSPPSTGLPKATLSLDPPWVNVLQGDNVTLTCRGAPGPGSPATRWFHNGNFLETQAQSSYSLTANSGDSGNYTCHTAQTSLSDPVHLDVVSGQWARPAGGRAAPPLSSSRPAPLLLRGGVVLPTCEAILPRS